jgi:hypothetical protein
MKKIIFTVIMLCIVFLGKTDAQVLQSYTFQDEVKTYEEISGGTVVWQGADGGDHGNLAKTVFYSDTEKSTAMVTDVPGIPIGFNFLYGDEEVNRFAIGSHGYVFVGKDKVSANPTNLALVLDTDNFGEGINNVFGSSNTIATGSDVRGVADTEISYKLIGGAPGRVLVVQFKKIEVNFALQYTALDVVDQQIRIYEGSNQIEIIYNDWQFAGSLTNRTLRAGLKGASAGGTSANLRNAHVRVLASTTSNISWLNNTTFGTNGTLSFRSNITIPNGLVFRFTPPADCTTPEAQPTGLTLSSTGTKVSGSFTATTDADHYLVILSESATLSANPADLTLYSPNNSIGGGIVVDYTSGTSFVTPDNLSGSKTYYVHVFATNSSCSKGPKYNRTNPLTGSVKTLPAPPQISLSEGGLTNLKLLPVANIENDSILVAVKIAPSTFTVGEFATDANNNTLYDGVFGTPTTDLNVGDNITGGGKVVYKGLVSELPNGLLEVADLTENSIIQFAAWSYKNGALSTVVTKLNTLTWGKAPYDANFKQFIIYDVPLGWEKNEGSLFSLVGTKNQPPTHLGCTLQESNSNGVLHSFTTQWIKLSEGNNKLTFNIQITETSGGTGSLTTIPYSEWDERDSLVFQLQKAGDTEFTTVYAVSVDNNNTFASQKFFAPFSIFGDEYVKVKVNWLTHRRTALTITEFKVENKPDCDIPFDVKAASITAKGATITWKPQGGEEFWDVRYKAGTGEWSEPAEASATSYQLTGLPANTAIQVEVRSKCSLISIGPWSETYSFTTKKESDLPFSEDFTSTTGTALPTGWTTNKGVIGDPTEFTGVASTVIRTITMSGNRLMYVPYTATSTTLSDWVFLPVLDFGDGSVNYKFSCTIGMASGAITALGADSYFTVAVSKDGGQTFSINDLLNDDGKKFTSVGAKEFDLAGYSGKIQFAFYFSGTATASINVSVDNIAITASCPTIATDLAVSDVVENGAKITWSGTSSEWLAFKRKVGETTKDFQPLSANEWILSGLDPATAYEVGVTHSCTPGDTAAVKYITFITASDIDCPEVTAISATPGTHSVVLDWETTREAASYNVFIRPVDYENGWIKKPVVTKPAEITGLEPNTDYEYRIQAICSAAAGDVSDSTEVATFKTLSVTCFAPVNVNVTPSYRTATVVWEDALAEFASENYEVIYRIGSEEWLTPVVVTGAKTTTLSNLTPETAYSLRVRSLCSDEDFSQWSAIKEFTTIAVPPCAIPTGLNATGITYSTAVLNWVAENSNNIGWEVRYREGSGTTWTDVTNLAETTYLLENLKEETAYVWTVRGNCEGSLDAGSSTSTWANTSNFTTLKYTGIQSVNLKDLNVFISNKIINILNPDGGFIEHVQLYDANGLLLKDLTINTFDNVLIPVSNTQPAVIVKVYGKGTASTFKVLVK